MRDDGITPSVATSPYDDDTRRGGVEKEPPKPRKKSNLDGPKAEKLLCRLREWYDAEWQRQAHNRFQQAMDEDYYDGLQWTEEEASVLIERGQAPAVYNEIKPTIDWLLGTERRTRIDYKVLPRRKEASDDAEVKTKLLKYLSDVNGEPYARSKAFAMAAKSGLGWLEVGVRGDDTDEPIYYRSQSWRYMLYDSNSVELDLSDARYVFRWKYLDVDVAKAFFPDRAALIGKAALESRASIGENDEDELWYMGARVTEPGYDYPDTTHKYRPYDGASFAWTARDRVKIVECWYREPMKRKVLRGPFFEEQTFEESEEQQQALARGEASLYDKSEMQIRCALFCDAGLLWEGPSPYKHGRFPFVPVWAYRRARDNAPYGPVRNIRDPQDGVNKRSSKALWILSTNQVEMEEGAVDDIDEMREEASRPDGVIVRKRGYELAFHRDNVLAREHLMLMERDQAAIRQVGGVTSENLGRETNATSGRAIVARQEQGSVVTTELFDNLRQAVQLAGEIELSLVEQFFTEPKVVRLVGDRGNAQFIEINEIDPVNGELLNDVTKHKADFFIAQQDYRDSLRQAMFESLFDVVSRLAQMAPEVAFKLLDLVVEMADVPNRDELVSRIRQLNGMRDPDSEPTPQEQQQMQQQMQEQMVVKELALARAKAELAELQGKVGKLDAEAVEKRLESMLKALEAAGRIATVPMVAQPADEIMRGAGYVDQAPQVDALEQAQSMMPAGPQALPAPSPQAMPPGAMPAPTTF